MAKYRPTEPTIETITPPDPVNVLMGVLQKSNQRKPTMFPAEPRAAATYWISHQEEADEYNERLVAIKNNQEVTGWKTPYHDRLASTLKKLHSLKPIEQVCVIEKVESGIPWRGDDMGYFVKICEEAEKMAKDKQPYIDNAFEVLKKYKATQ